MVTIGCLLLAAVSGSAQPQPAPPYPPPPRRYGPPVPPPGYYPYPPPPVAYGPPPGVVDPSPPPLSPAMRVIYAPFYAAGLILRYGLYYAFVAPLEVLGRTISYGVEGGVEHRPPPPAQNPPPEEQNAPPPGENP